MEKVLGIQIQQQKIDYLIFKWVPMSLKNIPFLELKLRNYRAE